MLNINADAHAHIRLELPFALDKYPKNPSAVAY